MTPRTALVVGGSRGLGRAAAAAFVADGWRVFAAARTDDPPPGAVFVPLDVTDPASVTAALATIADAAPRTAMTTASADGFNAVAHGSRWAPLLRLAALLSRGAGRRGSDPAVFGAAALRAATVRRPRHRYLVRPHFGRALVDRLPVPIVDAALATVLRVLTR